MKKHRPIRPVDGRPFVDPPQKRVFIQDLSSKTRKHWEKFGENNYGLPSVKHDIFVYHGTNRGVSEEVQSSGWLLPKSATHLTDPKMVISNSVLFCTPDIRAAWRYTQARHAKHRVANPPPPPERILARHEHDLEAVVYRFLVPVDTYLILAYNEETGEFRPEISQDYWEIPGGIEYQDMEICFPGEQDVFPIDIEPGFDYSFLEWH